MIFHEKKAHLQCHVLQCHVAGNLHAAQDPPAKKSHELLPGTSLLGTDDAAVRPVGRDQRRKETKDGTGSEAGGIIGHRKS